MPWLRRYTNPEVLKASEIDLAVANLVEGEPLRNIEKSTTYHLIRPEGRWFSLLVHTGMIKSSSSTPIVVAAISNVPSSEIPGGTEGKRFDAFAISCREFSVLKDLICRDRRFGNMECLSRSEPTLAYVPLAAALFRTRGDMQDKMSFAGKAMIRKDVLL